MSLKDHLAQFHGHNPWPLSPTKSILQINTWIHYKLRFEHASQQLLKDEISKISSQILPQGECGAQKPYFLWKCEQDHLAQFHGHSPWPLSPTKSILQINTWIHYKLKFEHASQQLVKDEMEGAILSEPPSPNALEFSNIRNWVRLERISSPLSLGPQFGTWLPPNKQLGFVSSSDTGDAALIVARKAPQKEGKIKWVQSARQLQSATPNL
jgi:hypothetical protein